MRLIACLFPLFLAVGCHADGVRPPAPPAPGAGASATDTLARIRALAAKPSCTDDSQCRSLALGATPCGGPESYLPWSSTRTPPDEVNALGRIYEAERRQANQAVGRVSTCRFTPDPGAVCRAGTCELGASAPVAR